MSRNVSIKKWSNTFLLISTWECKFSIKLQTHECLNHSKQKCKSCWHPGHLFKHAVSYVDFWHILVAYFLQLTHVLTKYMNTHHWKMLNKIMHRLAENYQSSPVKLFKNLKVIYIYIFLFLESQKDI